MQVARGRLKGLLNNLMTETEEEDQEPVVKQQPRASSSGGRGRPRRSRLASAPRAYVMKLFDRCVNVTNFNEETPLYPICRAWFFDRKKNPDLPGESTGPIYYNGREPLLKQLQMGRIERVAALPPPNDDEEIQKIPYCEPPALENGLNLFTVDYVSGVDQGVAISNDNWSPFQDWENPVISTQDLTASYIDRWRKVREAWQLQSRHYSQRYEDSFQVLETLFANN